MAMSNYASDSALVTRVEQEQISAQEKSSMSSRAVAVGRELGRYGLVVIVGWIGLMKFTTYEAEGIRPFVAHSPLLNWVHAPLGVPRSSNLPSLVSILLAI